jgi:hypothetical protein
VLDQRIIENTFARQNGEKIPQHLAIARITECAHREHIVLMNLQLRSCSAYMLSATNAA